MLMRGEPFIVPTVERPLNIKDAMILKVFRVICYRSLRKLGGFLYGGGFLHFAGVDCHVGF